MSLAFDRLAFPRGYTQRIGNPPCAVDSIEALDANVLPLSTAAPGIFPVGSNLRFTGWAIAPVIGGFALPMAVMLAIGDAKLALPAAIGLGRADVARDHGDTRFLATGFRGVGTISENAGLGRHALSLVVVCPDRTYYRTPLGRAIEIVESSRLFPTLPQTDRTAIDGLSLGTSYGSNRHKNRFVRGSVLVARGEALERDSQLAASGVFAIVDERRYYPGIVGLPNERGERSAFSIRIPTRHLAPGSHGLRIAAIAHDGASYTLGKPTSFALRRA